MKVALLCSGLGHVLRGHEIFARDLFELLSPEVDITLFKGGGAPSAKEIVVGNVPRNSPCLKTIHVAASPRWIEAVREQERLRIEAETFAYGALPTLLEGDFDVVHCLEQEVCNILFDNRHLFSRVPKVVFSNGGALAAADLPRCDAVQEHTPGNLARSARHKAFMIPHGVDTQRFRPGVPSDFRERHGIPEGARLLLSVGSICYWHKRMDYVIREVSKLPEVWLAIVGQETPDTPAILALGQELLGDRVIFTKMPHDQLPQAYAAADAFVLGSLFETFGIVYIEALAMGVPVFCTENSNQRQLVRHAVFVDMAADGALSKALRDTPESTLQDNARQGLLWAREAYDLTRLRERYIELYRKVKALPCSLPKDTLRRRVSAHAADALRRLRRRLPALS